MALTDSESGGRSPAALISGFARLRDWFTDESDHSLAQRHAGNAFLEFASAAPASPMRRRCFSPAGWAASNSASSSMSGPGCCSWAASWISASPPRPSASFPEYAERKEPALLRGFITGSRWITFGTAGAAMLLGMLATRLLAPWLDGYLILPLYQACATLTLYALNFISGGQHRAPLQLGESRAAAAPVHRPPSHPAGADGGRLRGRTGHERGRRHGGERALAHPHHRRPGLDVEQSSRQGRRGGAEALRGPHLARDLAADLAGRGLLSVADLCGRADAAAVPFARRGRRLLRGRQDLGAGGVHLLFGLRHGGAQIHHPACLRRP